MFCGPINIVREQIVDFMEFFVGYNNTKQGGFPVNIVDANPRVAQEVIRGLGLQVYHFNVVHKPDTNNFN